MELVFDLYGFLRFYPEFNRSPYTPDIIKGRAEQALVFFPFKNICNKDRRRALWFAITAHLLIVHDDGNSDNSIGNNSTVTGAVTSVSVGGVSTSFNVRSVSTAREQFLSTTIYGLTALSIIDLCKPALVLTGGRPEGDAFTSVYGIRPRRYYLNRRGWRC